MTESATKPKQAQPEEKLAEVIPPVLVLEHFNFEAKVFKIKGAWFQRDEHTGQANFHVPMGNMLACIPVSKVMGKFSIEIDGIDGQLLLRVEQALQYIPVIRNKDAIPSELINGEASWKYDTSHKLIAEGRLAWHLLSNAKVKVPQEPSPNLLIGFSGGTIMQEHGKNALGGMAKKIKKPAHQLQMAMGELADNLAYIEALKEHFISIFYMRAKFQEAKYMCQNERVAKEEFERILSLSQTPFQELRKHFSNITNRFENFEKILLQPEIACEEIQKIRNTLHLESQKWEPILQDWKNNPKPAKNIHIRRRTYHFLAAHWPVQSNWALNG